MGIFKQIGSLRNRLNPLKALQAGADRIEQHKTEAFIEMDKQIPAPKREIREGTSLCFSSTSNVFTADRLTDEEIDAKLAELEKKSNFAHDYMDMLDSVQISKPKELTEIDYAFRNKDQLQRPTDPVIEQRKRFELEGTVPRGKCRPNDLVDIIVVSRFHGIQKSCKLYHSE